MADDIAHHYFNPFPGVIQNRPGGSNVYKGVPKDYTGEDVHPQLFLNALSGKSNGEGKKIVDSGPNDKIFVYFSDHGSTGYSVFGNFPLKATDLLEVSTYKNHTWADGGGSSNF